MSKINDLIESEYSSEYSNEYSSETILFMEKIKYTKPKIYPKIVETKKLKEFTENEKEEILQKYNRWYVYYSYRGKDGKLKKQPSIFYKINKDFKDFDKRYENIHKLRNIVENILKNGFTPINESDQEEPIEYVAESAIKYALELKENTLRSSSFLDYKIRVNQFLKFLKSNELDKYPIQSITKKHINEFLNTILIKSSPRNRNNTLAVLKSIFSTLEENEIVEKNITLTIKKISTNPVRNKIYTNEQQNLIFSEMEKQDKLLLLFVKFVSYNFLRPVEVCRLQIKDIDFIGSKLTVRAKNKEVKLKIIPEILLKEIYHLKGSNKEHYLFTPNGVGEWETEENNKRDYWSKRFKKIKDKFELGEEYGLYSFRHTFITKLYRELRKNYSQSETYDKLMLITGHTTLLALQQYLKDIDAELPEDYSHLL